MSGTRDLSPVPKIAAVLATAACLAVWLVPPLTSEEGFFGCYTLGQLLVGPLLAMAGVGLWSLACARPDRKRLVAFRFGTVAGTLLLAWGGMELVYALVRPVAINPFYKVDPRWNLPDPELGFVRKPNLTWSGPAYDDPEARLVTYRTDRNGFRNPPGIERAELVFVGDSFTEAGNVPEADTFVSRAGEKLGVTAVNLGRAYYGPQHELVVLRRYALGYEPRVIVWVVFEGNDLTDAEKYQRGVLQQPIESAAPAWSSRALLSYRLLRPFLEPGRPAAGSRDEHWLLLGPSGSEREVEFAVAYVPDLIQRLPAAWEATQRSIQEGHALCRERGIELLVVFVPIKFRVYGPYLRVITPHREYLGPLPEDLVNHDDFGNSLGRFCERLGCRFLDTYPALSAAAKRGLTVYSLRYDTHFDVEGHLVVANLLGEVLADVGSVSSSRGGEDRLQPPG